MAKGINGKDLMLFKGTGVGKKAIGLSTSCSLAVNASVVAVTTKDSGDWDENEVERLSFTASVDQLFIETEFDDLFDAMVSKTAVDIDFAVVSEPSASGVPAGGWVPKAGGYQGKAVITSLNQTAPVSGKATCAISLTGTGILTKGA